MTPEFVNVFYSKIAQFSPKRLDVWLVNTLYNCLDVWLVNTLYNCLDVWLVNTLHNWLSGLL